MLFNIILLKKIINNIKIHEKVYFMHETVNFQNIGIYYNSQLNLHSVPCTKIKISIKEHQLSCEKMNVL